MSGINSTRLRTTLRKNASMIRALISFPWAKRMLAGVEWLMFGGKAIERVLLKLLSLHYRSRFRRDWMWSREAPHFFNHRVGCFDFAFGNSGGGAYPYCRGFYVSELLRQGDKLLDIGCGDGFFTKRFFAKRCTSIDAVDIEPDAINSAHRENASANIRYHLLDAVSQRFPGDQYDVIVWDGALGHFAQETTHIMLSKITASLNKDGVFVGSESLGREVHDHLQFFETEEDLDRIFGRHFPYRAYRVVEYDTGFNPGFVRREAFWRCSSDPGRLEQAEWKPFRGMVI